MNDFADCGEHDGTSTATTVAGLSEERDAFEQEVMERLAALGRTLSELAGRIKFLEDTQADTSAVREQAKFVEDKLLARELRLREQAFVMQNIPARLTDVEECIEGIERKLNLRRKKAKPEIPPPPY